MLQSYLIGFIATQLPHNKFMMTSSNGNIFRVTGSLCEEFTGHRWITTQRQVTRSFDVFSYLRLNKRLSKQPWGWWFETPSCSLWRQCFLPVSSAIGPRSTSQWFLRHVMNRLDKSRVFDISNLRRLVFKMEMRSQLEVICNGNFHDIIDKFIMFVCVCCPVPKLIYIREIFIMSLLTLKSCFCSPINNSDANCFWLYIHKAFFMQ